MDVSGFPINSKFRVVEYTTKGVTIRNVLGSDLMSGMMIQVSPTKYEPIIGFSVNSPTIIVDSLTIKYENGSCSITPNHLLISRNDKIPANELDTGSIIFNIENRALPVHSITLSKQVGVICPLTSSGLLIVNDIQFSCYTKQYPEILNKAIAKTTRKVIKSNTIRQRVIEKIYDKLNKHSL